jgi:hypothetical protein
MILKASPASPELVQEVKTISLNAKNYLKNEEKSS